MPKKTKKGKSAKRVAAGKRAWAKLSASVKAARIRALTGKAARKTGGRAKMAKSKGGRRGKQGIVSWITSVFALLIGLGPLLERLAAWAKGEIGYAQFRDEGNRLYNPMAKDSAMLALGYGSLIGGLVFKVVSSELVKRAKVTSVIPALHA